MDQAIQLDETARCFVLEVEGQICRLRFSIDGPVASFTSVHVPDAMGGRGIAGQLTQYALDWARAQGLKVRPVCPYVARWIERHRPYQDLLG